MFEYELHQIRSAELIREAENHRRVREALRARRETARDVGTTPSSTPRARSESNAGSGTAPAEQDAEGRAHRPRRLRFPRAA
ncbi:hypothetical protein Sipo8835_24870 [Streptomyces ipomoeae]|jgi:hypothetical protein|uniref:Uncharacterized protein n=1 Tax=Streptomyces ipomoeae TaxID=103232 RepID=A0AAE8VZM1_9ACTN|nr:hypothetical protein [Streptomyces ipomoeae]MDX2698378.1 hypothetical protein [Streptomyces ipomoeae]MDX2825621.1 hypothetical protein [Streptomyces ipomoeae]MDX2843979.1 hypothetical protein [Streptomyces ipomoeae]MDX2878276.1 hypothetical protein [Streptomyces ipomoeae]TQE29511.1 hypothetical protein Sipo8835_24870 [Streptomyces ipomoeae]